jgi:D-galactose 1-dehydrogenase
MQTGHRSRSLSTSTSVTRRARTFAETDDGHFELTQGGSRLAIGGEAINVPDTPEYTRLYARFAELITARGRDTNLSPFRLVADAFLLGERATGGAFDWAG